MGYARGMPTVLRARGYQVKIIPGDHDPPHVPVFRAGNTVRIELGSLRISGRRGLSDQDTAEAVRLVAEQGTRLLEAWEEINGTR